MRETFTTNESDWDLRWKPRLTKRELSEIRIGQKYPELPDDPDEAFEDTIEIEKQLINGVVKKDKLEENNG